VARLPEAEASAVAALAAAQRAGPEVERQVLYGLAWARIMRGAQIDDLCRRFRDVSDEAFYIPHSPIRVAVQRLIWRGEVSDARRELSRLGELADEQGEPASRALVRFHRCELELRTGELDTASLLLDEWPASDAAEQLPFPMYERCRALLAAGRGVTGEAERWVARAIDRGNETGAHIDRLEALRARGSTALLVQDPERARESLGAVWDHCCREGVDEPGAFPVAPGLVEALAELDETESARAVIVRLRNLSEQQRHPWGLASAARCEAILQLAVGPYDEEAVLMLAGAAQEYGRLGLRFDRAGSLLSLGRAQRRMKKWGPARESLQEALAAFADLGSPGWAKRVRLELGRVGARRPRASGELTATEREVVELAAAGRANKEIAQALSLAVHTVEVHLSRAYAKLGVRSRSQLAGRLSHRA
jgi:DNA-binding CsgD family transcriptional regulator